MAAPRVGNAKAQAWEDEASPRAPSLALHRQAAHPPYKMAPVVPWAPPGAWLHKGDGLHPAPA